MKKPLVSIIALLAVLAAVSGAFALHSTPSVSTKVGSSIETLKTDFGDGFNVSAGWSATKMFSQGGSILRISYTTNARTLTPTELFANSMIVVNASSTSPVVTLTLPSTTTMATNFIIPNVGDSREWLIVNNNTVAATTTTVIAGSGIDLQGPTTGDDVIAGLGVGHLQCFRTYDLSVICRITKNVPAD